MATFSFERHWLTTTYCDVEADTLEEALEKVKNDECDWVDGSDSLPTGTHVNCFDDENGEEIGCWDIDNDFNVVSES